MTRRLFTISAALSLVLGAVAAVLWVRSYWGMDSVERLRRISTTANSFTDSSHSLVWARGAVRWSASERSVSWHSPKQAPLGGAGEFTQWNWGRAATWGPIWQTRDERSWLSRRGFYTFNYELFKSFGDERVRGFSVPAWLPVLALAVLPALWVRKVMVPARRIARGRCPSCGYDLRATPERCPECGSSQVGRRPSRWNRRMELRRGSK